MHMKKAAVAVAVLSALGANTLAQTCPDYGTALTYPVTKKSAQSDNYHGTHTLDPYRPLARVDATRPLAPGHKPLTVEVVALDWKWLFIYPEQGIATVNELAAPVDVPVRFHITASCVMNSFYIPASRSTSKPLFGLITKR